MYKLNDIALESYGIIPGRIPGEGIAMRGCFDLPKRIGDTDHSWDDEDSVQAWVDADEIYLAGRTLLFQGIMIGDESTIKSNVDSLKAAISLFNDVVPFETPYGTFCVYVEKISTKSYLGAVILLMELQEPVVAASCSLNTTPTIYYSAEYSANGVRNNCDEGFHGTEVTLTAPAGMFTSTVSQAAADQLAIDWVVDNLQTYANVNGSCEANPTVYYNVRLEGSFQRDNCGEGYEGTTVSYVVPAYTYSSLISQEDADAQAQAELDANLTQEIANEQGDCLVIYWNEELSGSVQKENCASGYIGTEETYTVPAGTYSSTLSQAYANALAQVDFNENAQAHANEVGACVPYYEPQFFISDEQIYFTITGLTVPYRKVYTLKITGQVYPNFDYVLSFDADNNFTISYTSQEGETAADIIVALKNLINNTTYAEWESLSGDGIDGLRPPPYVISNTSNTLKLECRVSTGIYLDEVWVTQ